MFSFLTGLAGSAALGWIGRRVLEVGGWLTTIVSAVLLLPPDQRDVVIALLSGQGGAVSIAAYFGLAAYLWSQFMSFRSTTKPHVVTSDTKKKINALVLTEAEARAITGYEGVIENRTGRS